jgi:hypothetical protein
MELKKIVSSISIWAWHIVEPKNIESCNSSTYMHLGLVRNWAQGYWVITLSLALLNKDLGKNNI